MPVVLVPIATLTLVLFVIALALVITDIMLYIANGLGTLPWPLDKLAGPVKSLASGIAGVCGKLEHGIDHLIGAAWHQFARYLDRTWHHMVKDAHLSLRMAEELAGLAYSHLGIKRALHSMAQTFRGIEHGVKSLERWSIRIEHRIHKIEHDIARGIGEDLLPRTKALEREVGHLEHKVIPAIEAADAQAESAISDLWKWARQHVVTAGTAAFAGAVAIALADLGLSELRCSNFTRLLGKWKCGLGTLIDDLLGLAVAGIVLEGVCEFLPLIEAAFGAIVGPITHLLNEVPLGACENPHKDWANLSVAAGPLPPGQTLGPLAQ